MLIFLSTWLAIVIGVSALTYRLVEAPGIVLGRSLVQRLKL
jgi:peptidoglycan/LPS O-acetylase OafA/YrhL